MSKKNQNFKINPDSQIIQSILDTFGLENLEDDRLFTKEHMKEINTVQNIELLKSKLEEYYIPCKSRIYLNGLTEKKDYCDYLYELDVMSNVIKTGFF